MAEHQPRIVIVGGGFAGLEVARALGGAPAQVTLIDRQNHHLFIPLLYQVATAVLAPSEVVAPIRQILKRHDNIEVMLGNVTGVDTERREVVLGESRVAYDILVLATGSGQSYFGRDDWHSMRRASRRSRMHAPSGADCWPPSSRQRSPPTRLRSAA